MNPGYGIIMWIIVGALAGWIGSKIMGTDARQGGLANIVVGVIGAVIGGFLTSSLFGDFRGNNGLIASFFVSLLGACLVIGIWKAVSGRRRVI
ncbi:MAG TPA: GlsB/YeaQ/YmgE family stress response membrane protein [Polyangia bacterium]